MKVDGKVDGKEMGSIEMFRVQNCIRTKTPGQIPQ